MQVVQAQVQAFKVWRVTAVNLNRTRPVACIEAETFDDQDAPRIYCYLGFVYKFKQGCQGQPSLDWYTQLPWVLDFVEFLVTERQAGQVSVSRAGKHHRGRWSLSTTTGCMRRRISGAA